MNKKFSAIIIWLYSVRYRKLLKNWWNKQDAKIVKVKSLNTILLETATGERMTVTPQNNFICRSQNFFRTIKQNAMNNAKATIKELFNADCPECKQSKLIATDYDASCDKVVFTCPNCKRQFI